MNTLEDMVRDHELMLEQLEAERYSHSNETLAQVKKRINLERPETPHQVMVRRRHEAHAEQAAQVKRVRELRDDRTLRIAVNAQQRRTESSNT